MSGTLLETLWTLLPWILISQITGLFSRSWVQFILAAGLTYLWQLPFSSLHRLMICEGLALLAVLPIQGQSHWHKEAKLKLIMGQALPFLAIVLLESAYLFPSQGILVAALFAIKLGIIPWQRSWVDVIHAYGTRELAWFINVYRFALLSWFIERMSQPMEDKFVLAISFAALALLSASFFIMQSNLRRMHGYYIGTCHAMALSCIFLREYNSAFCLVILCGLLPQLHETLSKLKFNDRWEYHWEGDGPAIAVSAFLILAALAPFMSLQLAPWDRISEFYGTFTLTFMACSLMAYKLMVYEFAFSKYRQKNTKSLY